MHITFAQLKAVAVTVSETVTVASMVCNVLPKSTVFSGYPRVKKAYETGINFIIALAFNFRMCMPSLNLHIPGLGFEKPIPEDGKKVSDTHDLLRRVLQHVECKPGWDFRLRYEDEALRLVIVVIGKDSYNPASEALAVGHYFPVPIATYNEKSWLRWIFDCCLRVENHEMGEWFRFGNRRPFAPTHGPGEDPYTVHEYRPESDAQTLQDGSISEQIKV